jgi:hypothetical protein
VADRIIKVLEQEKLILRGLKQRGRAAVIAIDDNDTLDLTINWSTWLGSDTIDSVINTVTRASLSGASNTTTTATFKIGSTSSGWVEHRITTAGGLTKELLILVEVSGTPLLDDYGLAFRLNA